MSRTIKVSEEVYGELELLMRKRESFSQVVERLIRVHRQVMNIREPAYMDRVAEADSQ